MKRKKILTNSLLSFVVMFLSCSAEKPAAAPDIGDLVHHQNLGLAYLEENRIQEAKAEYEKIIQLVPQESLGYANLAITLLRQGDYSGANQQIQKAILCL